MIRRNLPIFQMNPAMTTREQARSSQITTIKMALENTINSQQTTFIAQAEMLRDVTLHLLCDHYSFTQEPPTHPHKHDVMIYHPLRIRKPLNLLNGDTLTETDSQISPCLTTLL